MVISSIGCVMNDPSLAPSLASLVTPSRARRVLAWSFATLAWFATTSPAAAQVTIKQTSEQIVVDIDGKPFTTFYIGGANLNRPYLYPLRTASGKMVTRSFPAGQLPGETT